MALYVSLFVVDDVGVVIGVVGGIDVVIVICTFGDAVDVDGIVAVVGGVGVV